MFPSGHMRSGVMDHPWSNNYGYYYDPNSMSCCSHEYNNCCYPPGPGTPYHHMYPPQPQPYVSMPLYYPHHHHQPIPSTNPNSYPPPDGYVPLQHNAWRPVFMPQSNCCCGGCPNHHPYNQANHINNINSGIDDKLVKQKKDESQLLPNVTRPAESVRPVLWKNSNNSSQPQILWIPPQYLTGLQQQQQQHDADMRQPQDTKAATGQLIPFDLSKLPSLHGKDGNKRMAVGATDNNFPFPFIMMPSSSEGSTGNNQIKEIEEKVKVKDIPVKQAGEHSDMKPSANTVTKARRSQSVSPTKTSKLPPVCLRVDPLPRKKSGNGTTNSPNSPSSKQAMSSFKSEESTCQKSPQNESKEGRDVKVHHHETNQAKIVKGLDSSCKESPEDKPVVSDGKGEEGRDIASEVVTSESAMHNLSEEAAVVRIQSAYRGYAEKKWQSLQKLRQIAKVREQISGIKHRIQALESDMDMHKDEFERQRLIIGETILSLLLTLDTIQGLHSSIRDIRKSVAKELISLQEKLDSFHGQRSRESELSMDYDKCDGVVVKEILNRNEEEGDMNVKVDETNQDVNRDDRSDKENSNAQDEKAQDEKAEEDENLENTVDFTGAGLRQKTAVEPANVKESQVETRLATNAFTDDILTTACGSHDETGQLDAHLKFAAQESQGATPVIGADDCKKVENVLIVGEEADSKVETAGDKVEGCGEENAEVIINRSGGGDVSEYETTDNQDIVVADDPQRVETNSRVLEGHDIDYTSCTAPIENGEVLSREVSEKVSTKEVPCEQETIAEIPPEMNDDGGCRKLEEQMERAELGGTHGVMVEQAAGCALVNMEKHRASDIESEESAVTDNSCGLGTQKPAKKSSESLEKSHGGGDFELAVENEKLRETVRKLLESEKEQLTVISTLNGRLKNLEKRVMKKGKRKVKLQQRSPRAIRDGMSKFANKYNDEDIVVC